jgi:Domain of unknown function (DUF2760)
MSPIPPPSFLARLFFLSWAAYFRTLFDAEFAARVAQLRDGKALPAPLPEPGTQVAPKEAPKSERPRSQPPESQLRQASPEAALQLLSLLQREGRFVDFLEEDVAAYPDAQIGAAVRVVHEGCRKVLKEHIPLEAIRAEDEGARVTLESGYDSRSIRLTGNVQGEAPFRGVLAHRGWRATKVVLPQLAPGHDAHVIMPAEVEL